MSTNVSSVVKFFPSAQNGFTTTLSSGIASGATIVPLVSVSGYNNGEVAVMIVEPTSATAKQTFTGTVDTAGVRLTGVVWTAGTNQTHSLGATVVDYESATHFSMIAKGLLVQHAQDGTHTGITSTSITNVGNLTQTGATALNGSWDGWVGANETWAYASATTITVPTNATTKYDIGDYIKITQSATVKYFVVTGVAATVLTVSGLGTVTVANSAITLPAYSKVYNPHSVSTLTAGLPYNPYKFLVYSSVTMNIIANPVTGMPFDTRVYDTGSNVDITVNKGRFTAPVAGFYHFTAHGYIQSLANQAYLALIKNGGLYLLGDLVNGGSSDISVSLSETIQLAASDYVDIYAFNSTGTRNWTGGLTGSRFSGFLVSAL